MELYTGDMSDSDDYRIKHIQLLGCIVTNLFSNFKQISDLMLRDEEGSAAHVAHLAKLEWQIKLTKTCPATDNL